MHTPNRAPARRTDLGPVAQETRERLLEALHELITTRAWRDVDVVSVARLAGTSPATFYQYFENLLDAFGAMVEHRRRRRQSLGVHTRMVERLLNHEATLRTAAAGGGIRG